MISGSSTRGRSTSSSEAGPCMCVSVCGHKKHMHPRQLSLGGAPSLDRTLICFIFCFSTAKGHKDSGVPVKLTGKLGLARLQLLLHCLSIDQLALQCCTGVSQWGRQSDMGRDVDTSRHGEKTTESIVSRWLASAWCIPATSLRRASISSVWACDCSACALSRAVICSLSLWMCWFAA